MIQFYYNSATKALTSIDTNDEVWVVGDNESKELRFYFDAINTTNVNNYSCRVVIELPDGDQSPELMASAITDGIDAYYKLTIQEWIASQAGTVKFTVRMRAVGGIATTAYGLATLTVFEGVDSSESTIDEAELMILQNSIDQVASDLTESIPKRFDGSFQGLLIQTDILPATDTEEIVIGKIQIATDMNPSAGQSKTPIVLYLHSVAENAADSYSIHIGSTNLISVGVPDTNYIKIGFTAGVGMFLWIPISMAKEIVGGVSAIITTALDNGGFTEGHKNRIIEITIRDLEPDGTSVNIVGIMDELVAGNVAFDKVKFDTVTPATVLNIGETRWNGTDKTLETKLSDSVTLQYGQEILVRARNGYGSIIPDGTAVYIYGEVGNSGKVLIKPASNTAVMEGYAILGLTTQSFAINEEGFVCTFGRVRGLNVSGYDLGTILYLGANGALVPISSLTKGTNNYVALCIVESNDAVFVSPRVRYNLDDLSGVYTAGVSNLDLLVWNATDHRWQNTTQANYLSAVTGRLDTAENDIDSLEGRATTLESDKEDKANKGQPNGYAPLGADSIIPSAYVPNSFDDVLEFNTYADLTAYAAPTTSKLYVVIADETSGGNHSTYRWTGSVYIRVNDEMSASEVKTLYESNDDTNAFTDNEKSKLAGLEPGSNYYDKTYINSLADYNGWASSLLTPTPLVNGNTILTATLFAKHKLTFICRNTSTGELDSDEMVGSLIVSGNKLVFFDNAGINLSIGGTDAVFGTVAGYELIIYGFDVAQQVAENIAVEHSGTNYLDASNDVKEDVEILDEQIKANNDVVILKTAEHDLRLASIEENLRKSMAGEVTGTANGTSVIGLGKDVANAPLKVEVDGGLIDSDNQLSLVSGTQDGITITVSGNQITLNGTASGDTSIVLASGLTIGNKAYVNYDFISGTGALTLNDGTALHSTYNADYSGVVTLATTSLTLEITSGQAFSSLIIKVNVNKVTALIAVKLYSPIYDTTFDLMSDAQIKAQMDYWVNAGVLPNNDIMAVGLNKRVRSVGKNLFDKSKAIASYTLTNTDGTPSSSSSNSISDFIGVKPNTAYFRNYGTDANRRICFYDGNKTFISYSDLSANATFTTPINCFYVRMAITSSALSQIQLEYGSTATTYEAYVSSDLFLQANAVGYKLPNLVKDTIEYRNGKYYYVKRVSNTVTFDGDAGESIFFAEALTNTARFGIVFNSSNFTMLQTDTAISNYFNQTAGYLSDYEMFGIDSANSYVRLRINKSRMSGWDDGWTNAQKVTAFKTWLQANNLLVKYLLLTPIETEILSSGNLNGYQNGTVYVDDVMQDADIYGTNATISNSNYPIKTLEKVVKIGSDGSQTNLAVSGATVASGGLSFTHTGLTSGDRVWFSYVYDVGDLFKSKTTVTFYDNKTTVTDSVTAKVYKITPAIADGVLTWALTEV